MKALFCTDGSEISRYALKKALTLIKKDFVIDIITVMETGFLTTYVTFPYEVEVGFPEYKNEAEKLLEDTANLIESKGFIVGEKIQLNGNPADIIVDLISDNSYNAVILGSHGKKGFKKWLGSVSRKVAYKSSIPIFIAKANYEQKLNERLDRHETPFTANNQVPVKNHENREQNKKILIAVDGSQNSYDAVRKANEIINFINSSIEILSVKAGAEGFPVEIRTDEEWLKKCLAKQDEIMNEILEKTTEILEEYNIKPAQKTLLQGDPAEEILKYTEKNHKDIIIMGSHGREGLASLLIGSVSKIILDNINISVLIIQNKPEHKY